MDQPTAPTSTPPPVVFRDGLGERHFAVGAAGEALEVLALSTELTSVPLFEVALREQVGRLAGFHHESHARVRGVLRLGTLVPTLALASDRVPGTRLADILAVARERRLPLDIGAARCLIRQLVSAVARLHEYPTDMWHGAIAPERIIITDDGRLIVTDHGLGTALEHLRYSHERYWRELRIALPHTVGLPRFDHRGDVTQVGIVALTVILGRTLADDDYPARIGAIADGAAALSPAGAAGPLPSALRLWLFRALQLDPLRPFGSAVEARNELNTVLADEDEKADAAALQSFLSRCRSCVVSTRPPDVAAPRAGTPDAAPDRETTPFSAADPVPSDWPPAGSRRKSALFQRRSLATAALVLLVLAAGTLAVWRYLVPPVVAEATGTLAVNTNPAGLAVVVDGQHRGASPVTLSLSPGAHVVQLVSETGVRKIPVTITAGGEVSQFIEMPAAAPVVGSLQVRTEPPGATVTVDGHVFGTSPVTVDSLAPGAHTVVLDGELGSVEQQVTIESGATASLVVPLRAPKGLPVSGWFSLSAPLDVQVYEGGRLLGSSDSDRIMVSAGRHNLEIVNESLGFRTTRSIQVTPGRVSSIKLDAPNGTLSINAVPWAEVWINGAPAGETPIGGVSLPIGSHSVVFRHPELGEQRATALVTLKGPARLSVDLRKK